jgi:protein-S-isoprenylcysteine O-methyltransferase Ste14
LLTEVKVAPSPRARGPENPPSAPVPSASPAPSALALLAIAWVLYFAIHSGLASLAAKRWVARRAAHLVPIYRLGFNVLAVLLLAPPLALMQSLRGPWLWTWEGAWGLLADGLSVLAVAGFLWTLRYYDGSEFLGLRQWRADSRSVLDQEAFHLSPLHRAVRHPWYTLGLVLVWTRDMDTARLVSAVMATLYLALGLWLEERKLIVYHGQAYEAYRRRVPALLPRPWRVLSAAEAAALDRQAAAERRARR